MKNISITIKRSVLLLLIAILSIITIWTGVTLSQDAVVLRQFPVFRRILTLALGVTLSIVLLYAFNHFSDYSEHTREKLKIFLWAIIIAIQLLVLFLFNPGQITDAYMINDQAIALAEGKDNVIDQSYQYFLLYKNNHFLTILLSWFYSFCIKLNLLSYSSKIIAFFNCVCIDISIFFLCKISSINKNESYELNILTLSALNPMNYLLIHWIYSLVISLPLMVIPIYLIYRGRKQFVSILEVGLICVFGYFIRPTIVIPILAIVLYYILTSYELNHISKLIVALVVATVASAILYYLIDNLISNYALISDKYLPMIHWYMMGMHGDGGAYATDISYIGSFANTEQMYQEALGNIRWTRTLYTPITFASHELLKLAKTWANGSADYRLGLYTGVVNTNVYDWICGGKEDFTLLYCQVYRFALYALSLYSCVKLFIHKKVTDERWIIATSALGGIIFYMLWEAKAVYSVPFLPFFVYLAADAGTTDCLKEKRLKVSRVFLSFSAIITFLAAIVFFNAFTNSQYDNQQYSIYTQGYTFDLYTDTEEAEVVQTFTSYRPFNTIEIEMNALDDNARSTVELLDSNDNVLAEQVITASDIKDNYYAFSVPYQDANGGKQYTLRMSILENGLEIYHMKSKYLKLYEGSAYSDNKAIPSNINMRVSLSQYCSNMTAIWYIVIFGLILLIQIILIFKTCKTIKKIALYQNLHKL